MLFPLGARIPACASLGQAAPEIAPRVPSEVGRPPGRGQGGACLLSCGGAASGTYPHGPESPHCEGATGQDRRDPIPQGLCLAQPGSGVLPLCPVTSGQGWDRVRGHRRGAAPGVRACSWVRAFGKCQMGPGAGWTRPLAVKRGAADHRTHGPRDPAEAGCPRA